MQRTLLLAFATTAAIAAVASLAMFLCFLNNIALATTVDRPIPEEGCSFATLTSNALLIVLFGLQHSGMARDRWKNLLKRCFTDALVASVYVLASAICLFLLMAFWQPIPPMIWSIPRGFARFVVYAIQCAGWGLTAYSAVLIDPLELLGLRRAMQTYHGKEYCDPPLFTGSVYRYVRHPLLTGALIGIWAMPDMTLGRSLLNVGLTAYVFIGAHLEERSLLRQYGEAYRAYCASTPRFIPRIFARGSRRRRG